MADAVRHLLLLKSLIRPSHTAVRGKAHAATAGARFVAGALLIGALGSVLLRHLLRLLGRTVEQARAIGERRFISTDTPTHRSLRRS